jgi:hypothetical protein
MNVFDDERWIHGYISEAFLWDSDSSGYQFEAKQVRLESILQPRWLVLKSELRMLNWMF